MSKIFYDHLVVLEEVDVVIKGISKTDEEKEELWQLVDDIVNHRLMISILDKLPTKHHDEFLSNFYEAPHDEMHISYLNERMAERIEDIIKREVENLKSELLHELKK